MDGGQPTAMARVGRVRSVVRREPAAACPAPARGAGAGGPAASHRRSYGGAVAAACSGNLVEWFDLHVSGLLTAYLAAAFFPASGPAGGFLNIAGIFAAGILARPIGGWVFGSIADRSGRRRSLVLSSLAMCVGFLVMALVPTYAGIGGWAPLLLLFARIIQGFAVGGEYGSAAAYIAEVVPPERQGFYGSFQYLALIGGQLAALLTAVALQRTLGDVALGDWGWRIPFVFGAIAALGSLAARLRLQEPPTMLGRSRDAGRMAVLLRRHGAAVVRALALTGGGVLGVFTFGVYARQAMVESGAVSNGAADGVMTACLFVFMGVQPLCGRLADRFGARNNIVAFGVVGVLCTVPILYALRLVGGPLGAFALTCAGLAITGLYTSVCGVVKAGMFPADVRGLAVGFCSSLASVAFAGSAALVVSGLAEVGFGQLFYVYVTLMLAVAGTIGMTLKPQGSSRRTE